MSIDIPVWMATFILCLLSISIVVRIVDVVAKLKLNKEIKERDVAIRIARSYSNESTGKI